GMHRVRLALTGLACAFVLSYGCGGSGGGHGGATIAGSTASLGSSSSSTSSRPEYLRFEAEDAISARDLIAMLGRTVGATSSASSFELRKGFVVTATPSGANVILRVDADAAGARQREPY